MRLRGSPCCRRTESRGEVLGSSESRATTAPGCGFDRGCAHRYARSSLILRSTTPASSAITSSLGPAREECERPSAGIRLLEEVARRRAEEVRATSSRRPSDARPLHRPSTSRSNRIGRRVHELVDHRRAVEQSRDARSVAPIRFAPARTARSGSYASILWKCSTNCGSFPCRNVQHRVVEWFDLRHHMERLHRRSAVRREAVLERVVRLDVETWSKLSRCSAGEKVELALGRPDVDATWRGQQSGSGAREMTWCSPRYRFSRPTAGLLCNPGAVSRVRSRRCGHGSAG